MQQTIYSTNEKADYSIPMEKIGGLALLLGLLPTVPFVVTYGVMWGWRATGQGFDQFFGSFALFWLALLGGTALHELLHGFTWMAAGRKPLRVMKYGVQWKTFTPYAHSTEPMPAWAYRLGVVMPALLLGFVPMIAGLITANGWLFFFGVIFTLAAGGDFLILWLLRPVKGHQLVEDHPENAGCFVYAE